MKSPKVRISAEAIEKPVGVPWWGILLAALLLLYILFQVYAPAQKGPFVFDDLYTTFLAGNAADVEFSTWLNNSRPLVNLTYYWNYQNSGTDPEDYHTWNLLLHYGASIFVGLAIAKLLQLSNVDDSKRAILAMFGAAVFLVHPAQTEAVAYVSSRSENLAAFFYYAAFVAYIYGAMQGVTWLRAGCTLVLFAGALLSKEYSVTLPVLLLLTDYFWNPGFTTEGIKKNWRLYALLALGAVGAVVLIAIRLGKTVSVGKGDPLAYFYTQCRVIWYYARLFVAPFGMNVDHDVPISKTLVEHGALIGLVGLILVVFLAWKYRREYPLASYGVAMFLLLLSPTSSIVPIDDVMVDRRIYLPMVGLILIALEVIRRIPFTRTTLSVLLSAVLFILAAFSYQRNQVWANPVALWQDAVDKSPNKYRPRFQLAFAQYNLQKCQESATQYRRAMQMPEADETLMIDAALAFDCIGNPDESMAALNRAYVMAEKKNDEEFKLQALLNMGQLEGKRGRNDEALEFLNRAATVRAIHDVTYQFRGIVYVQMNRLEDAKRDFETALRINVRNDKARQGLELVNRQLGVAQ
jgi:protein O-mannosyl-transferase